MVADCTEIAAEIKVVCRGDNSVDLYTLKATLNLYGEAVKTRTTMVTLCHMVSTKIIDALAMALDIDPTFFQLGVDRVRTMKMQNTGILGLEPPDSGPSRLEVFGRQVVLDSLYAQLMQTQRDVMTKV